MKIKTKHKIIKCGENKTLWFSLWIIVTWTAILVDLGRTVEQAKWISIDHALTISNPKRIRSSEPKKTTKKKPNVEQRNRSGQIRLVTCNWLGMSVFLWLVFEPNVNSVSFIYQRFSVVNFRMPFISFVCWSLSLILKSALIDNDLAINIVYVLSLIDGAFQLDRLCVFTFSQALNLIHFNTLHLQPILPCLFFCLLHFINIRPIGTLYQFFSLHLLRLWT